MKKIYFLASMLAFYGFADAQTLNQSAGWPNAAWTVTGSYSDLPAAFESDPRTTANFAFDDDDATNGHEDNIAVESPVIDLTAAFAANEKALEIVVMYGYRYLADDVLQFQYWDAIAAAWVAWPGGNIAGNNTSVTDNFCTITKTQLISPALSLANFTPAQLTGFKYRISYDDKIDGADWNYGFCFDSPTLRSVGCISPSGLATANITSETADISWTAIDGVAGYEVVLNQDPASPTTAGTPTTDVSYAAGGFTPSTTYYFHVRTNCGSAYSFWTTIAFTTSAELPSNDACGGAIAIASFPYTHAQDATLATNNDGFITGCTNASNDGVWYTFVGDGGDITVTLTDVVAWDPQLTILTGACGAFECVGAVDTGLTGGGETYTVTGSELGRTYYVNVAYWSGVTNAAEGPFAINVTSTNLATSSYMDAQFKSYPNPVTNVLNVSYTKNITGITVYNMLGQQVLAKSLNAANGQVDLSALNSGTYIVNVAAGKESKTIKVVKL